MSGEETPVVGVHFDGSFSRMETAGGHIGSFNNVTGTLIYNATAPHPRPAPLIPAPRCPPASLNFVGREQEQAALWEFFFGDDVQLDERRIFSIVGIGGCGKTQLARKFMKRVHNRFSKKSLAHLVFYIDGTTQATIEASLVGIAKANGLEESSKAAVSWMSNLDQEFFMYIDNADDPIINLRGYFSHSDYARIIITTRLPEKARHYSQGLGSIIHLGSLSEEESVKLLLKMAHVPAAVALRDKNLIITLVKELCYLPLAVVQAGACISKSRWTVKHYLEKFNALRTQLLDGNNDKVEASAIDDYRLHVYTTWKLSYDILPARAQTLLCLCSYLHHTGITEQLFKDAYHSISKAEFAFPSIPFSFQEQDTYSHVRDFLHQFVVDESWNTDEFKWCMQEACSTSLLSLDETEHYSIHPLIHDCLRGVQEDPTATALTLAASIDSSGVAVWIQMVPHIQHLLTIWSPGQRNRVHCQILGKLGNALSFAGWYSDAEKLLHLCLIRQQQKLGVEHPDTIFSTNSLAITLRDFGRYNKAELMQREVLEKAQQTFGSDHPNTIDEPRT